jgi:hypothetical protein
MDLTGRSPVFRNELNLIVKAAQLLVEHFLRRAMNAVVQRRFGLRHAGSYSTQYRVFEGKRSAEARGRTSGTFLTRTRFSEAQADSKHSLLSLQHSRQNWLSSSPALLLQPAFGSQPMFEVPFEEQGIPLYGFPPRRFAFALEFVAVLEFCAQTTLTIQASKPERASAAVFDLINL